MMLQNDQNRAEMEQAAMEYNKYKEDRREEFRTDMLQEMQNRAAMERAT